MALPETASWSETMAFAEAIAARAASQAAAETVRQTFQTLGLDIDDPNDIRVVRESFGDMRERWEGRKQRKEAWRKSVVHGFVGVVFTMMVAAGSFLWHGK